MPGIVYFLTVPQQQIVDAVVFFNKTYFSFQVPVLCNVINNIGAKLSCLKVN